MEHAAAAGMTEKEYWNSSPRHVGARIRAHRAAQQFQYESGWEQSRLVAWATVAVHDRKKKMKSHKDWMPFPWENTARARQIDEEKMKAMQARLDEEAAKFFGTK